MAKSTKFISLAAVLAVTVGIMVLVGWAFDIAALKSIQPGWFPMKANFAVALILIGIALKAMFVGECAIAPSFKYRFKGLI